MDVGTVLNERYKVLEVLGKGGMGCVYLVEDLKLGCPWALKEMIFPFEEGKEEALKQFKREAQILAKVKHPHLPKVFDYFEEKNRYYLVMEYIDGLNLMEVLEKNGKLHWKKALDYALQICDVLKFLHKQGIIYRDLKPSNIMVDPKGNVYLIDFGIARFFKGKKICDTVVIGTVGFAPPEQMGKAETDERSDIYSLGATLHYLLTGKDPSLTPFVFEDPSSLVSEIPQEFSKVVMKALSLSAKDRYQKVSEMERDLKKLLKPSVDKGKILPFRGRKVFKGNSIKKYLFSLVMSAGIVSVFSIVVTGGNITFSMLPFCFFLLFPVFFLVNYFTGQGETVITLDEKGVKIKTPQKTLFTPWNGIKKLIVLDEGTVLITSKGRIEYGDIEGMDEVNRIISKHSGLVLKKGKHIKYEKPVER